MRILLLRTWPTNIGNGFIYKGARAWIERALPDAEILEVSGFPFWAHAQNEFGVVAGLPNVLSRLGKDMLGQKDGTSQPFSLQDHLDVDVAILPGCLLHRGAIEPLEAPIRALEKRGIPVLLLGAAGMDYSVESVEEVQACLDRAGPTGMITRDRSALEAYRSVLPLVVDGIDCAFFVDEWYSPPSTTSQFTAVTIDHGEEPPLGELPEPVVRPHHEPFGSSIPYYGPIRRVMDALSRPSAFDVECAFVSDRIEDYLTIYANSREVYSDRIHACVPALVYGNKARLYLESDRVALMDRAGVPGITERLVELPDKQHDRLKDEAALLLKETIRDAVSRAEER